MGVQRVTVKVCEFYKGGEFCGYRRTIGGKMFYFGKATDRRTAERQAAALLMAWEGIRANGGCDWTQEAIDAAMSLGGTLRRPASGKDSISKTVPAKDEGRSLYDGMKLYAEHLQSQTPHQVSTSHFQRIRHSLEWSKASVKDRPLTDLGYDAVAEIVAHFVSRPTGRKSGKPLSAYTVLHVLQAYRLMLTYLEDSGRWDSPRNWLKAFKIKRKYLFTREEKQKLAGDVVTFTLDELTSLYRATADSGCQRLFMLLSLNTGGTQQELSSYLKDEFHLKGAQPALVHPRNKTGVMGRWRLWPETARLVAERLKETPENPAGLAFLTSGDKPLVWYNDTNKMDSVKLVWARLLKKCPTVRPLSYKYLRKTASQIIRDLSDLETSQAFLAHAGQSVAERHYNNRCFDKLDAALVRMRKHLKPMFAPVKLASASRAQRKNRVSRGPRH